MMFFLRQSTVCLEQQIYTSPESLTQALLVTFMTIRRSAFHRLGPLGRVGHRVAMFVWFLCVCLSVIKVVTVDNGQSIRELTDKMSNRG